MRFFFLFCSVEILYIGVHSIKCVSVFIIKWYHRHFAFEHIGVYSIYHLHFNCMLLRNFITQLRLHLWLANWMCSLSIFFAFLLCLKTFFPLHWNYTLIARHTLVTHAFKNRIEKPKFFLVFKRFLAHWLTKVNP